MSAIRYLVLTGAVFALVSCSGRSDEEEKTTVEEKVTEVFQKYRTALLEKDGLAAWSLVDFHTQNYYAEALRDALSMPKTDLDRLDFLHKLTVLRLRHEYRKSELQQLTGQKVFVIGIANGWISRSTVESIKPFHRIAVNGNYAAAYLQEAPEAPTFHFIDEGSDWKLALWKSFELANQAMDQMRQQSGLSQRDFIIKLLESVSKYTMNEAIFDGPID